MGQLTISMAMFNGFLYVYQRVNTMEGSGWFSFVRGWTETWLKHWNHQWIHGSLLRYPYHINYIYIYIQYITLISYAHFVWLISIHFPASLQKHRQNVTRPGRRATLPMFQRTPSGLTTLLAAQNPCSAIVPDEQFHQLVILRSMLGAGGW